VTVLDVDEDGYADRIYAADLGGRIWRFDIKNGNTVGTVVAGGILAAVGAAELGGTPTRADTRRFYNAPDVALVSRRGAKPYYNIAIGSGYRGHPLDKSTNDRFYAIRDYFPFGTRAQSDYTDASWKFITEADLKDVTTDLDAVVEEGKPGWLLRLASGKGGEKVLADSTTVGDAILFPTFEPSNDTHPTNPCLPATQNRAYTLRIDSGKPFFKDRSTPLKQGGIAAQISVLPNRKKPPPPCVGDSCPPPCTGDKCEEPPKDPDSTCITGVEKLKQCVPFGEAIRTFWQRN
jgi:type IV pilus assembly protein PilY1